MDENKQLEQKEKKEQIEKQMLEIYNSYQSKDGNPVVSISYYNELILQDEQFSIKFGLTDVYPVEIENTGKKEIYNEGRKIALIDEKSNIVFSTQFLIQMKERNVQIYLLLKQIDGQYYELPEIGKEDLELADTEKEQKVENFSLTKEELERRQEISKEEPETEQEETKDTENEENIEQIAKKSGLTKDDIKSCSSIDPKEKITDSESFEDIANISGNYTKILVSNSNTKGNSRFAFWGITPDGNVELIPGLEEREGVNTGKTIYGINRDGSEVKQQQTSALFTLPNQKEGFSVTIGQYGIVETTYIRKSPTENKYIGCSINSSTQKPTTKEVQEFMDDKKTTDRELQDVIEDAEHELSETEKTNMKNIDDNPYNDVALDIDAPIEMHDGTITTLRKEAEKLEISPEEYVKEYENTEGKCTSDKIANIALNYEERERGERLTPEEQALRRRGY